MTSKVALTDVCFRCKLPFQKNDSASIGTGRGQYSEGREFCYGCCARMDEEWMDEKGKILLYYTIRDGKETVSNWPGTLIFRVLESRTSHHNIGGTRYDLWFNDRHGRRWHGIQIGRMNEVARCKRLKA